MITMGYLYEYTVSVDCDNEDEADEYGRKEITVSFVSEDYGDCSINNIWKHRDAFDPPSPGFEMFADSCPDTNVPYLLVESQVSPEDIALVEIGGECTIWVKWE